MISGPFAYVVVSPVGVMKMSPLSLFAPCVSTVTGGGAVGAGEVAGPATAAAAEDGRAPARTAVTVSASRRWRPRQAAGTRECDRARNGVLLFGTPAACGIGRWQGGRHGR